MRLKGGKVLLDLTSYPIEVDVEIPLESEVVKAIIEKGCVAKLYSSNLEVKYFCVDLIPSEVNDVNIKYNQITDANGDIHVIILYINANKIAFETL